MMPRTSKIRVLIVDDSAIVRKILSESLAGEPDIEVVGTAPDPYIARDKIVTLRPDVLTLDVEMPRMDGLTFLKKLMRAYPLPVIMISSLTQRSSAAAIEALAEGAVEVLAKPSGPYSVGEFGATLAAKIRAAAATRPPKRVDATIVPRAPIQPAVAHRPSAAVLPARHFTAPLIVIGASTGGTEAVERILLSLPPEMPPIMIVQHIPAGFSRAFAERLDKVCRLRVKEAADGDAAAPGTALVAPGNFHLKALHHGASFRALVETGAPVCYQRPAVDVLFKSVAALNLSGVIAVLLTGMGSDGADGMVALRTGGAHTIAQDEASCAVFGMPKEAIRRGGAVEVLALDRIAARLLSLISAPVRDRDSHSAALTR